MLTVVLEVCSAVCHGNIVLPFIALSHTCIFIFDSDDFTRGGDKVDQWLESLKNISRDPEDYPLTKDFFPIFHLWAQYVPKLYGKNKIMAMCNNNKGTTLPDIITMSDCAYVVSLMVNNSEVWKQAIEIKAMPKEEQEKFKAKNHKLMSDPAEKEKYLKKKPKFTDGGKKVYLGHGWTEEGIKFYESQWKMWRKFSRNKVIWTKMKEAWDVYVVEFGFGKHWKEKTYCPTTGVDGEEERVQDLPANRFSLPEDEDFEGDGAPTSEDESEEEEKSEEREYRNKNEMTWKELNRDIRSLSKTACSSSEEESSDEDVPKITPKKISKARSMTDDRNNLSVKKKHKITPTAK